MKNTFKKIWSFLWKTALLFIILSIFSVVLFRWVPVPITPLMLVRCVEQKRANNEIILKKDWMPLEKISPNLQLAVVCSEDQNFVEHSGFDFKAINNAFKYNQNHKKKRGASTISQQTAKNVFLWQGRSWFRKGLEVYFTFLIEIIWSKERIMEVYLNVIEMGKGIYGAQAAAHYYFHKEASNLSKSESALIAAALPNPIKFSVLNPTAYILKRRAWIIHQMALSDGVLKYKE
ncbi:MAG: monofunctional biosynthetic peptidoglycan transglycosylase [Bacteroidia bacterium]